MENVHELMDFNVGRARNKKVLLISSCIVDNYPEMVKKFLDEGYLLLKACPEKTHINMIGYKLASVISYSQLDEITVLSVDGSFHCVQLQYVVEDIRKHFINVRTKHLVLEKGKIFEVSEQAVKISRHIHRVEKLIKNLK